MDELFNKYNLTILQTIANKGKIILTIICKDSTVNIKYSKINKLNCL